MMDVSPSPPAPSPPPSRSGALPELLLPAGSFESGLAAFEGGADAVYLGFNDFSARRQARNFDRLEYRRLLRLAAESGKKIYVAINTIILESELPALAELLSFLVSFPPDAVILQDWGLAALIRADFPSLPIHASTQTAIQGRDGARLAASLGVTRVILPRETSPLELATLAEEAPGLEFEVFVHGALCYSFSGLCLASGLLLGRSGNRGECAQLCRSYYEAAGPGISGRGYWFSCRDLSLIDRLGELWRAGASGLKVEGRMKSPEYAYALARLYRGGLESLTAAGPGAAEMEARLDAATIAFSRAPTAAYARHHAGSEILDPSFPGHRGLRIGTVLRAAGERGSERSELLLALEKPLGLRDGLLAFGPERSGLPPEALQYPVLELREAASGRTLFAAEAGAQVLVSLGQKPDSRAALPEAGSPVFRISAREQDRKKPSPDEHPPALLLLPAELSLEPVAQAEGSAAGEGLCQALLRLEIRLPSQGGGLKEGAILDCRDSAALAFSLSKKPGGFLQALGLFGEGGEAEFRLAVRLKPDAFLELPGLGRVGLSELFVPPSLLKKAKNRLYAEAARLLESSRQTQILEARAREPDFAPGRAGRPGLASALPPRSALVFPHPELGSGFPFASPRLLKEGATLPSWGGCGWLPLSPLVARPEDYERLLLERLSSELIGGASLMVGIGALHHIELAARMRRLAEEFGAADRLAFFGDIHLYAANRHAVAEFARLIPGLVFVYHYLEAGEEDRLSLETALRSSEGAPALAPVGEGFRPPLFLSKACLLRHHAAGGSCPSPCSRRWSARMQDRSRSYLALVEDCVSMLFEVTAFERPGKEAR